MSESNKVNKIIEFLKNKHYFSEALLISHPNQEDIKNKSIRKSFSTASKTKKGKGKNPGKIDIYYCNEKDKFLFLIEVKPEISQHEEAIEDIKHYLSFFQQLSTKYKIIGLAFSGDVKNKPKIDAFVFKKGEVENANLPNHLLSEEEYLAYFEEKQQPLEYGKIRKIARELNEIFRQESWGLGDKQKPFFISACLLALDNKDFNKDFCLTDEELKIKHRVNDLVSFCKSTIETKIKSLLIGEKRKAKYNSLKNNLLDAVTKTEKLTETKSGKETYFVSILRKLKEEVAPYLITELREDIIGHFYHEFLKYSSSSDGKILGITLTPSHITELFCDLSLKLLYPNVEENKRKFTEKDKILDICCGTGTFLVSALSKGANKRNLYGIELDSNVYDLALTNMILWQDGRSHIYRTNCFDKKKKNKDKKIEPLIKKAKCNIGFINPPYSLKKSKKSEGKSEIEFIHHLCNLLEPNSYVFAIVPLSVATGNTDKEERKAIMKEHTLEAVMTMPSNLFVANASGSHTCIMVWRTNQPHTGQTQTWLANWKDDGFVVSKGKREPKDENIWHSKKKQWLDMYCQEPIRYVSTFQTLTAENKKGKKSNTCWLADAYVETDYSPLFEEGGEVYFEKTIRDYLAFLIANFHSPQQLSLEQTKWEYFYLGDEKYFKISRGKWKETLTKASPKILFDQSSVIPIISSSKENNGVDNFIEKSKKEDIKINSKHLITIANNGSVGESFFQQLEFQATSDVTILELVNQELNEHIAFFLCSIIKMERFRYSWGRKWGLEEMRNSQIKLPQDEKGKPDWKFMENHSKKIFSKIKESIYQLVETERERERERERAKVVIILLQNGKKLKLLITFTSRELKLLKKKMLNRENLPIYPTKIPPTATSVHRF